MIRYVRTNPRLIVAIFAAGLSVVTLALNTYKSIVNDFTYGLLQCMLTVTTKGNGLGGDCATAGPCALRAKRFLQYYEARDGADIGSYADAMPFGFACEAGPFENETRVQWPVTTPPIHFVFR